MADRPPHQGRAFRVVLVCTVACYLLGYPLALGAHQAVGWVFVTLGGPLLIVLGVLTIRRLTRPSAAPEEGAGGPGGPDNEVADDTSTR
jgi:hypothetical protein